MNNSQNVDNKFIQMKCSSQWINIVKFYAQMLLSNNLSHQDHLKEKLFKSCKQVKDCRPTVAQPYYGGILHWTCVGPPSELYDNIGKSYFIVSTTCFSHNVQSIIVWVSTYLASYKLKSLLMLLQEVRKRLDRAREFNCLIITVTYYI